MISKDETYLAEDAVEVSLPPARVLDLGCGHGSFVAILQQQGSMQGGRNESLGAEFVGNIQR